MEMKKTHKIQAPDRAMPRVAQMDEDSLAES